MTILMGVPQYPFPVVGGLEKQAHELAMELVALGVKVLALSGRITVDQPDIDNVDGVEVHRLTWPRQRGVRWLIGPIPFWRRARQLIRRADVVHVHVFSGFGLFLILLARFYRKPVLVKLPNVGASGLPGLASSVLGPLKIKVFARADAVVAMSKESLSELQAIGFDSRHVLATPNGISVSAIFDGPQRIDPTCRFVFVGRLHKDKGIFDLLSAVKSLLSDPDMALFTVDVLGDGALWTAIDENIRASGLSARIGLRGHIENVREALTMYDALILPSYHEGNSNVILEAMAAGLPVISTRVGGTPMLVGEAGSALLHAPGDVRELTRLMGTLVTDARLRREIGAKMRNRVQDSFDIPQVAKTYVAAYHLLLDGRLDELSQLSNPIVMEGR